MCTCNRAKLPFGHWWRCLPLLTMRRQSRRTRRVNAFQLIFEICFTSQTKVQYCFGTILLDMGAIIVPNRTNTTLRRKSSSVALLLIMSSMRLSITMFSDVLLRNYGGTRSFMSSPSSVRMSEVDSSWFSRLKMQTTSTAPRVTSPTCSCMMNLPVLA